MERRNFNKNPNYRRSNNRNDNSQKEVIKENVDEFKEVFVKANNPEISHIVLEEQYFDAPNGRLK